MGKYSIISRKRTTIDSSSNGGMLDLDLIKWCLLSSVNGSPSSRRSIKPDLCAKGARGA